MGDKVRRLSDAMRLGATIHPQIYGNLFAWENVECISRMPGCDFRITGTCALGGAIAAIGRGPESVQKHECVDYYMELERRWPEMVTRLVNCPDHKPGKCVLGMTIINAVAHLNDNHCWPREKIADWLEGLGF